MVTRNRRDDTLPVQESEPTWVLYQENRSVAVLRTAGAKVLDGATSISDGASYTELGPARRVLSAPTLSELVDHGVRPARAVEDQRVRLSRPESRELVADRARELVEIASAVEAAAREAEPSVSSVLLDAEVTIQDVWITADGIPQGHDHRETLYLTVRAVANRDGRRATGFLTPGLTGGGLVDATAIGREVARRAAAGLDAVEAPGGRMPVVVGPGRGAVLIHEACCHPLEGDEVIRGSVYARKLGEQVAAPCVTITDDPTVEGGVGSARLDDEGTPAAPTVLVSTGRLENFLLDRASAQTLGSPSTGNGRRASWRSPVIPRMTNTVVSSGTADPMDLVGSVRDGIYAEHVGGGQVSEQTGEFVFRVLNARRIRNGRLAEPVRETTLAGTGPEVLRSIEGLGNDSALGSAKCGKHGQLVPVGVAGPTMLIRELLVGRA